MPQANTLFDPVFLSRLGAGGDGVVFTPASGELTPALGAYLVTADVGVSFTIQERLLGSSDAWVVAIEDATGTSVYVGNDDTESPLYWPATNERRIKAFIGAAGPYYSGIYTRT